MNPPQSWNREGPPNGRRGLTQAGDMPGAGGSRSARPARGIAVVKPEGAHRQALDSTTRRLALGLDAEALKRETHSSSPQPKEHPQ